MLFTIVIVAVLFWFARKPRVPGRVIGLFATMYAPVRFGLDFLRATDVGKLGYTPDERYGALTPAQWACVGCLAVGVWLLTRKGEVLPPVSKAEAAHSPAEPAQSSPTP